MCIDYVSLTSCDEYREYRKYISSKSSPWWTLAPYSCTASFSCYARLVGADGTLYYNSADNWNNGVAPAFLLSPSVRVEIAEDKNE
jgi:hypothetical protein